MALQGSGTSSDPFVVFTSKQITEAAHNGVDTHIHFGCNIQGSKSITTLSTGGINLNGKGFEYHCYCNNDLPSKGGWCSYSNINFVVHFPSGRVIQGHKSDRGVFNCSMRAAVEVTGSLQLYYSDYADTEKCVFIAERGMTESGSMSSRREVDCQRFTMINPTEAYPDARTAKLSDYSQFSPVTWEQNGRGFTVKQIYSTFFSGKSTIEGKPLPSRKVRAISVDPSFGNYDCITNQDGEFYLKAGDSENLMLIVCSDLIDELLVSTIPHYEGITYVPKVSNGFKYTCTKSGSTDLLPEILPINGNFISGTAEFNVSPIYPTVSYGPVIGAKVVN